jgi:hypothetical protein
VFEQLDFVYMPSRDMAADIAHFTEGLGGELVFGIEAFETRVAMVRLAGEPDLLLAEHLEGEQPVLVFRVDDLEAAIADLEGRGAELGERFGIPPGEGVLIESPGPQRLAIYEVTRPGRLEQMAGRRDF